MSACDLKRLYTLLTSIFQCNKSGGIVSSIKNLKTLKIVSLLIFKSSVKDKFVVTDMKFSGLAVGVIGGSI